MLACTLLCSLTLAGCTSSEDLIKPVSISEKSARIDAAVNKAMAQRGSKGVAYSYVRNGKVQTTKAFGYRNAQGDPLTVETVMYGASLTKTVFAYLVGQLVDEGVLELDKPISEYIDGALPEVKVNARLYAPYDTLDDDRWRVITPRILLTHSAGFANFWFLEPDRKLHIHFDPGSRYAYSGDGFILLQYVLEQGLGLDVRQEMTERIFGPLGMTRTGMVWDEVFATDLADGWNLGGEPIPHDERSKVRAAGSMDTTISDIGAFVATLIACQGLLETTCNKLLVGNLSITTAAQFPTLGDELAASEQIPGLSAALGSISFDGPQGPGIFKSGHNDSTGNIMVCLLNDQECILLLSNDVRTERAFPSIVRAALGDTGVPWNWQYSGLELIEY